MLLKSAVCASSSLASSLERFNKAPHSPAGGAAAVWCSAPCWAVWSVMSLIALTRVKGEDFRLGSWEGTEGALVTALLTLSMCELCKHNK